MPRTKIAGSDAGRASRRARAGKITLPFFQTHGGDFSGSAVPTDLYGYEEQDKAFTVRPLAGAGRRARRSP